MSNQLSNLLKIWFESKDESQWVLGTVYKTQGSAYRKAGSYMLINGLGRQLGLLSGGCLEADIVLNSRKVMQYENTVMLVYDSTDQEDLSFQLGLGCGGKVYIMLQLITNNNDLGLCSLFKSLKERRNCIYYQKIGASHSYVKTWKGSLTQSSEIKLIENEKWLVTNMIPEPHILIVGGGVDAIPVVNISKQLGWTVTLVDPRVANARKEKFPAADFIIRKIDEYLISHASKYYINAAIIMSHSINIDADALLTIQSLNLKYVGLLGPVNRFSEVLKKAGLKKDSLKTHVSSPAGFDIGGQLPESIALSILSECHGFLYGKAKIISSFNIK